MRGDFRLANEFKKQNPRKIMKMWAEKEMLNLKRMKKFGICCPEVCIAHNMTTACTSYGLASLQNGIYNVTCYSLCLNKTVTDILEGNCLLNY